MKILIALVLVLVPVVLAGDFAKAWAELEQELKDKLAQDDNVEDAPKEDGWGEKDSKGWGDRENKGWGEHRSRGWGARKDRDDDDVKENVKDLVFDFKQYVRRKALKESEEKNAKAEIYRQMETVQMKKFLTEKLEQLTVDFEAQRMKFVFQTTFHFLALCPGVAIAKDLLERFDGGQFADQILPMNDTATIGNMGNNTDGAPLGLDGEQDPTKLKWFADMEPEDKVKYALHGFLLVMCGAAQNLAGEIQLIESRIEECKSGNIQCDLSK